MRSVKFVCSYYGCSSTCEVEVRESWVRSHHLVCIFNGGPRDCKWVRKKVRRKVTLSKG